MCAGINCKIGWLYVYKHLSLMCGFIQNVKHFVTYKIIIPIISFVTPLILISSGNHGDFRKSSCFQNLLRLLCWKAITAFFSTIARTDTIIEFLGITVFICFDILLSLLFGAKLHL